VCGCASALGVAPCSYGARSLRWGCSALVVPRDNPCVPHGARLHLSFLLLFLREDEVPQMAETMEGHLEMMRGHTWRGGDERVLEI
jgi:hypothetical protein